MTTSIGLPSAHSPRREQGQQDHNPRREGLRHQRGAGNSGRGGAQAQRDRIRRGEHGGDRAHVHTDESSLYQRLDRPRSTVNHSRWQFLAEDGASTNEMESLWPEIKRGIRGVFRKISPTYAQCYVEFHRQAERPRQRHHQPHDRPCQRHEGQAPALQAAHCRQRVQEPREGGGDEGCFVEQMIRIFLPE